MKYILNTTIFENVSNAKKFLTKLRIPLDDENFTIIKDMLRSAPGYTLLFTKLFYSTKEEITVEKLQILFNFLKELSPQLNNLPKQIDQYDSYMELIDDLMIIESHTRFNKVIAEIPSSLKNVARNDIGYFNLVSGMSDEILSDYIKLIKAKVSGFKNLTDLITATTMHINTYTNKKEVLDKIRKTPGANLVSNENNIIIVHIETESAAKVLGSPVWCTVSRGMWSTYVNAHKLTKQYFVWNYNVDFSNNDFQLGATILPSGIPGATHLKNDTPCSLDRYCEKYDINMSLFEPLDKPTMIEMTRGIEMTREVFKTCIALDMWEDLIDLIPLNWRITKGLVMEEEVDNMSEIETIILKGDVNTAVNYVNNNGVFNYPYERYQLLNKFDFKSIMNEEEHNDFAIGIMLPLMDGDSNDEYEIYINQGNSYIEVTLDQYDDFFRTTNLDEYNAHALIDGIEEDSEIMDNPKEFSEQFPYFLSEELREWLHALLDKHDITLSDDPELWYEELEENKLDIPIYNFAYQIIKVANIRLMKEIEKARKLIIFPLESINYDENFIIMDFDKIVDYLNEYSDLSGGIMNIVNSKPNDVSDVLTDDSFYINEYTDDMELEAFHETFKKDMIEAVNSL